MLTPFDDTPAPEPSPVWHFLWRNVGVVLFVAVAFVGMLVVYGYFRPPGAGDVDLIAAVSNATAASQPRISPITKPVANRLVRQRFAPSTPPLSIGIIVGHRGSDSGAVCEDGLTELTINTNIAQKVFLLLTQAGIHTTLLDEFDDRLTNYEGTALISIHADSCVYYGDDLTGFKIAGSSRTNSAPLVDCLNTHYQRATGLNIHLNTITGHMIDYHAFRKIAAGTPAAIVETGFMYMDRELLTTGSDGPAQGIAGGILCYLQSR
jgi:N-acetylmuramoyl-L-alanine amidase